MNVGLEETIYLDFITSSATGAAVDADSTPTFEVFEDATDTAMTLSGTTIAKRTSKTGNYRITLPVTAANTFEISKCYNVIASATIGTVAAKCVVATFKVDMIMAQNTVVDGTVTFVEAMRAILAFVAGKTTNGNASPLIFYRQDGTTAALTFTVDENGTRSVVAKGLG